MISSGFIAVAIFLRLFGGLAYLKATLSGRAKPNALSWLLWSITPLIAFVAELSAGVGFPAFVTLAVGISPMLVFLAAMWKDPRLFKIDSLNLLCAALAIVGIVLWQITDHPQIAIILAILADIASAIPTIRKIPRLPHTEYPLTYLLSAISMIVTLLTIKDWSFAAYAFPAYVMMVNFWIVILITISARKKKRQRKNTPHRTKK